MRPFQPTVVRGLLSVTTLYPNSQSDLLLEVDPHDDQEIISGLFSVLQELFAVCQSLLRVVDGTWSWRISFNLIRKP